MYVSTFFMGTQYFSRRYYKTKKQRRRNNLEDKQMNHGLSGYNFDLKFNMENRKKCNNTAHIWVAFWGPYATVCIASSAFCKKWASSVLDPVF